MANSTILIGSGGHARVVASAFQTRCDVALTGYVAPERAAEMPSRFGEYLGGDAEAKRLQAESGDASFLFGIGCVNRKTVAKRLQIIEELAELKFISVVHPEAKLMDDVSVGKGSFVAANAFLGLGTRLGQFAIVNSSASVEHDCIIGDNVHIAVGAVVAGGVTIGNNVLIGANATILQGITIQDNTIIGAGAVVTQNVAAGETIYGHRR